MSEQEAWDIYFASICSLRHHPKNDDEHRADQVVYAARVADQMLVERRKRWHGQQ
jgi:hypothetical protein